jgi:hypothetical protein
MDMTLQGGFRSISSIRPAVWARALLVASAWLAIPLGALAQPPVTPEPATTAGTTGAKGPEWEFSASVFGYFVPDDRDYAQPSFTADRDWLHLEARYNYEDQDTASAWFGCNLAGGEVVWWELTPMLGAVFGNTAGIAPGYRGAIGWWKLELASEGEYVFDAGDTSDSFFYNWSELTVAPIDWLRVGVATQRTRAYRSERDIQRGVLLGASFKRVDATLYVFNPDDARPTVVVAVGVGF